MKRLFISLAVLLMLGIANTGFTDSIPVVVDAKYQPAVWTRTVYNNYSNDLTSGTVVIWDADAATGDYADLLPYITTTTSADDIKVAGVVLSDTILAGQVGEIVVFGPAITLIADSTDTVTEDQLVGTVSVRGQAGAYSTGTDTGHLGYIISDTATGVDFTLMKVFVNPGYEG